MSSQPPLPIKFITQNDPRGARRISPPNQVFTQPKTAHPGGPLQWHLVWQEELPGGRIWVPSCPPPHPGQLPSGDSPAVKSTW